MHMFSITFPHCICMKMIRSLWYYTLWIFVSLGFNLVDRSIDFCSWGKGDKDKDNYFIIVNGDNINSYHNPRLVCLVFCLFIYLPACLLTDWLIIALCWYNRYIQSLSGCNRYCESWRRIEVTKGQSGSYVWPGEESNSCFCFMMVFDKSEL